MTPIGRLAVQFGVSFALTMALVGLVVFVVATHRISNRVDQALAYHAQKFVDGPPAGRRDTAAVAGRIAEWQARKIMSERTYILFDRAGRRVAGRLALPPLPDGFSDVRFKAGGRAWQTGRALARRLPDGGLFIAVQNAEAAASLRAMLLPLVACILAAAVLTGLAATFLFARLTARRLAATHAAASAIAAGDLSRRIAAERLDGMFAVQARSLNAMLDRMELMVNTQRHFASALAHDLRTPLTRLKGVLALASAQGAPDPDRLVERAGRECAAIIAIFDSLLRLAEIETGRHPSAMQVQPLGELVADVVETMEPVVTDAGSRLVVGRIDVAPIRCDPALITQLVINLLENVLTHTPAGTRAMIELTRQGSWALLQLADNGPGLTPDDRWRVLKPFERGSSTSARGSGLGLAIVRAIVEFHGGELELGENTPGLRVVIRLPLAQANACPEDQGASRTESRAAA